MIDFYHSNICTFKKGGIAVCHANIPLHASIQIDLEFESCTLGDFNFIKAILINIFQEFIKCGVHSSFPQKKNLTDHVV